MFMIYFIISLIAMTTMSDSKENDNAFLRFFNYNDNCLVIPEEIKLGDIETIKDLIFDKKELLDLSGKRKFIGKEYDFLMDIDFINEWDMYSTDSVFMPLPTKEKYIAEKKREFNLYYFGSVVNTESYNSFLILKSYSDANPYLTVRELLQVCVKGQEIKSITIVSKYYCADGACVFEYTRENKKGVFEYLTKVTSSDFILPKELDKEEMNEVVRCKYYYDKNGYLYIED